MLKYIYSVQILSVQFSDEHLPWMSRDIIKVQQLVGLSVWYMFLFVESKKKNNNDFGKGEY